MKKKNVYTALLHIVCWMFVFLPTLIFTPPHEEQDLRIIFIRLCFPMLMCVVFYVNYLWLVPCCFIKNKRNVFFVSNSVLIFICAFLVQALMDTLHHHHRPFGGPDSDKIVPVLMWIFVFIVRNVFLLAISAGTATLLRLSLRWQQTEAERRELEIEKTESELLNLRNQINPHFLLNTLNNIYALIAFDQEKAQRAVLSLSSMLRQMLYGSQENSISLEKEIDFLNNYIDLMRLRMSRNVKIDVHMESLEPDINVAPFIFISLVENAFKHGVSLTEPSFISIDITADSRKIVCEIRNSNFPKASSDHSGHGIGLTQVARRLDLGYPGRYEWTKGTDKDKKTYISKIIIYDTKLRNN